MFVTVRFYCTKHHEMNPHSKAQYIHIQLVAALCSYIYVAIGSLLLDERITVADPEASP